VFFDLGPLCLSSHSTFAPSVLRLMELFLDFDGSIAFYSRSGVSIYSGIFQGRVDVFSVGLEAER
ncbi:hypothetical protein A2U01_0051320, partial [Trifolium medium]|nr:hypothetical protein [Trifolium medium]